MSELSLASEFPAATREQWSGLVDRVLKGGDFDKKLVSRSYDGLRIEPLYPKAEGAVPISRARHAPWHVAQALDHPDPDAANALALADLEGGTDALTLRFDGAPSARGFGLKADSVEDLDRALSGVMLDLISVRIEAGLGGREAMASLLALAERRGHALDTLDLDLGLDPIGALAATGRMSAPWTTVAGRLSDNLADLSGRGFTGRVALADGRPYHEAGGSEAQELAAVLATALAYLRALEAGGHALEASRDSLSFLLVTDADEFLTVAKFRALRRLWAQIETACGLAPRPIRLHAETAWRMTTRRDPFVNILRGTMAAFSAGIGGADVVGVLPFTAALGLPDAFARRIARNTQLILLEESNLWRIADPVAGAGGFEAMTDALAAEAWTRFREIEREGGIVESLVRGALQARIAETQSHRESAVATRRDPITGTSAFPHLNEAAVPVLLPRPRAGDLCADGSGDPSLEGRAESAKPNRGGDSPARSPHPGSKLRFDSPSPTGRDHPSPREGLQDEVVRSKGGTVPAVIAPLPSVRLAEPYERLRDRSDAILALTGARPRIFLANLGIPADFTTRSTFARNAFEAGGIEVVDNDGFGSAEDLAAAFAISGAAAACLCSSDEVYAVLAAPAADRLRAAGAQPILLAGRPGEREAAYEAAGIGGYLAAGGDLPRLLSGLLGEAA